jgi:hypothetical protein
MFYVLLEEEIRDALMNYLKSRGSWPFSIICLFIFPRSDVPWEARKASCQ